MLALARHEPHNVPLGLTIESAVEVDAAVVGDGGVAEPVQVGAEVPGDGVVQTAPGVTENIIGEELPAVALGALTVLGVIVGVAAKHQHQPLHHGGAVQVPVAGAGPQHRPLALLMLEGVKIVAELGHAAGQLM